MDALILNQRRDYSEPTMSISADATPLRLFMAELTKGTSVIIVADNARISQPNIPPPITRGLGRQLSCRWEASSSCPSSKVPSFKVPSPAAIRLKRSSLEPDKPAPLPACRWESLTSC
jgi:hypothetical protein